MATWTNYISIPEEAIFIYNASGNKLSRNMNNPRRPGKALLPSRVAADNESLAEVRCFILDPYYLLFFKTAFNDQFIILFPPPIITEHDTVLEKRRLQHYVGNNVPTSFCNHSLYMEKADCWDPNCLCDECHPGIDGLGDCPLKIDCAARRDLSLLNTRPLMRHVFSNPVLEVSNDFLQNGNLVYDKK